jgi:hypothetical protein
MVSRRITKVSSAYPDAWLIHRESFTSSICAVTTFGLLKIPHAGRREPINWRKSARQSSNWVGEELQWLNTNSLARCAAIFAKNAASLSQG